MMPRRCDLLPRRASTLSTDTDPCHFLSSDSTFSLSCTFAQAHDGGGMQTSPGDPRRTAVAPLRRACARVADRRLHGRALSDPEPQGNKVLLHLRRWRQRRGENQTLVTGERCRSPHAARHTLSPRAHTRLPHKPARSQASHATWQLAHWVCITLMHPADLTRGTLAFQAPPPPHPILYTCPDATHYPPNSPCEHSLDPHFPLTYHRHVACCHVAVCTRVPPRQLRGGDHSDLHRAGGVQLLPLLSSSPPHLLASSPPRLLVSSYSSAASPPPYRLLTIPQASSTTSCATT